MSTATISASSDRSGLLRKGIAFDGVFAGATGLILLIGAGSLADVFGLSPLFLRTVGAVLIPYSIALFLLAPTAEHRRSIVWIIIGGNISWTIASGALLLTGWIDPTTAGVVFIVSQAVIVAGFAEVQFFGLRRAR